MEFIAAPWIRSNEICGDSPTDSLAENSRIAALIDFGFVVNE